MRYLPLNNDDRAAMLKAVGVGSVDDLFVDVPKQAMLSGLIDLPLHKPEATVERELSALAAQNVAAGSVPFFCGAGAYKHHIPATVDHLIQRSEFLTAYTPYQPEISQGTLQTLFEFQTQVAMLTGMDVANASMYDGSTACAEAVMMAVRVARGKKTKAVLASGLHPHYAQTTQTSAQYRGVEIEARSCAPGRDLEAIDEIDDNTACVVVQSPNLFGEIIDLEPFAKAAHEKGALLIAVFTEPVAFGAIKNPGEQGADIVVGEGQSIGVGLNFGGPYVGLFACRSKLVRQMPGRICGQSVDADGRRAFTLTLSTREQHIRREKATSNICTNSGLCCLAFSIHMTLLGEAGLRRLAALNHANACKLADKLSAIDGVSLVNKTFFNEFTLRLPMRADQVVEALARAGILGGVPVSRLAGELDNLLLVTATEVVTDEDMAAFENTLKAIIEGAEIVESGA